MLFFCEKMYNFARVGENLYTPIYTMILSYYTITFCLLTNYFFLYDEEVTILPAYVCSGLLG